METNVSLAVSIRLRLIMVAYVYERNLLERISEFNIYDIKKESTVKKSECVDEKINTCARNYPHYKPVIAFHSRHTTSEIPFDGEIRKITQSRFSLKTVGTALRGPL